MAALGLVNSVPTKVLREFAKQRGIPLSGSVIELRSRIQRSVSADELADDPLVSPYLTTRATQNYRYYCIDGLSPEVSLLSQKIKAASNEDAFGRRLKPVLGDTPVITYVESVDQMTLAIDIAFRGDARFVQNDWDLVTVWPPIFARVIYRPVEKLIEVRGPRQKLDVIQDWAQDLLGVEISILTFTLEEYMHLKAKLGGKTYSIGKKPRSGTLGLVRLTSSDVTSDVEADPASLAIGEVLGKVGGSDSTSATVVFWDYTKIRANERQGSFYIPRHVNEAQLAEFRAALLAVKGIRTSSPIAPALSNIFLFPKTRHRELKLEYVEEKVSKVTWLTDEQKRDVAFEFKSMSRSQQKRLLPEFFAAVFGLSSEQSVKLCKDLKKLGLLEVYEEALCFTCGAVSKIDDNWDGYCWVCQQNIEDSQEVYAVKGFIEPLVDPDKIFMPNHQRLRELHSILLQSRIDGSNDEKKRALEDYVAELFEMIDGVKCVDKDSRSSMDEIDVIFQNNHSVDSLIKRMAPSFLVLCRNTADPVDAKEVTAFREALALRDLHYGVYVSVNGFTGFKGKGPGTQDCKQVFRDSRQKGYHILTLDLDDLESINKGRSLVGLLWEKYNLALRL